MSGKVPERQFVLRVEWGADTRKDLAHALRHVAFEIESELTSGKVTSGGPSDGGTYSLRENPGMTHDKYFEEVDAWLKEKEETDG